MGPIANVAVALLVGSRVPPGATCCIDKEPIRKVVRSHLDEVRACVDAGRARLPELEGRVELEFVVENGKVTTSYVYDSTLGDAEVGHCIAAAARKWKFARGRCRLDIRYPFVVERA